MGCHVREAATRILPNEVSLPRLGITPYLAPTLKFSIKHPSQVF
jgi:hypothetical protein